MSRGVRKVPSYPPSPIRVETVADFTGGLNTRANAFQLGQNETPDCLDVDLQIGGGFVQRKVVTAFASANPAVAPMNMWAYTTLSSSAVVIQGTDGKLYTSSGSTWSTVSATVRTICQAAEFNGYLYIMDGTNAAIGWDGTTAHTEGVTFNEVIGTEGAHDGNVPLAKLCTAHMGRLFIAYTTESAVAFPNRIRWSHAGFPEDWRQEDFIDIDVGRDGDFITNMVEFREKLYIFKNNSTYELAGYGPATFQVIPIAQDIGCVGPLAATVTDVGLFTFSWPNGVYLDKGTGPYPIFDKIYPTIRDGFIPSQYRAKIALGYVNRNLWVGVPWGSSTTNARTLIYDPWIWKNRYMRFLQGPWYPYSLPISCFATLDPPASNAIFLGGHATQAGVGQLEQTGSSDVWGSGITSTLNSYYKTNWYDMGQEGVFKRWRHPDFVIRTDSVANIQIDVRRDYDPDTVYKTYFVQQTSPFSGGLIWDTSSHTTGGKWDDGTGTAGADWNDPASTGETIVSGQSMGVARAVQLTFTGPSGIAWGLDALTLKWITKRLRG